MFAPSAEALIKLVDAYQLSVELDASPERGGIDVMGFSQGGAMSNLLAFLYPQRIRKTGILAGFVPSGLDEIVAQRPLAGQRGAVAAGQQPEALVEPRGQLLD
jgi:pimeloyl-ACP methyl ester carboxylesterase